MNESEPAGAPGLPLQGPHWSRGRPPAPPDFLPLRLVLQPSGWSVELTQPDVLVGRHTEADVRLPLPDVSRRHCRFVFADGCWQVHDLNSLNGVWVNGQQVRHAYLHHHDQLRIGGFTFVLELRAADPTEQLPAGDMLRSIADALPDDAHARRRAS
ncbi:MAG TPA: FHA domain-containing protein [Gemmataceae bacterium]|nr:FHA domain-containing protein [Gemmataceae bacterium]